MRLFGFDIKAAGSRNQLDNKYIPRAILSWLYGREYVNPQDQESLINAYKSWVYVCASRNADTFSSVPIHLYATKATKETKIYSPHHAVSKDMRQAIVSHNIGNVRVKTAQEIVEIEDHRLIDLLYSVNDWMNFKELFTLTDLHQELTGNSYWYVVPEKTTGLPAQIWPLPPHKMCVVPSKEKYVECYVYSNLGHRWLNAYQQGMAGEDWVRYEPEEIIHFKFPNPKDPYYGASPLQAVSGAHNINENMNTFENALFTNNARPEGFFTTKETLGDSEFERLKVELKETMAGMHNSGQSPLLDGDMDYKQMSWAPRELSFLQGRQWTKAEIFEAYGQPTGLYDRTANRANADAAQYVYAKFCIEPRLRLFEEKLNERLTTRYDDKLFVAFDSCVPEDREFELKNDTELVRAYIMPINEVRAQRGLDPVPWGDEPFIPSPFPAMPSATEPELPVKTIKVKAVDRKARWESFVKTADKYESRLVTTLQKYFAEQEDAVLGKLSGGKSYKAAGDDLIDADEWAKKLAAASKDILAGALAANANREIAEYGFDIAFDVQNPRVLGFMDEQLSTFSEEVTNTTVTQLRDTVSEGTAAGETLDQLKDRVRLVFGEASDVRSMRIARTETTGAANFGAQESYTQAGVEKQEWLATLDSRVRDTHAALDGDVVEIGDKFNNGLRYPGDPAGDVSEIVNCRCTLVPVIE